MDLGLKFAEGILSSKTLDGEKVQEMLLDHTNDHPEPSTVEFCRLLVKHAMARGELKSDISAEAATLFTKSMMESLGHIAIGRKTNRKMEDPTDKEMDDVCSEFFSILRDGLAEKDQ